MYFSDVCVYRNLDEQDANANDAPALTVVRTSEEKFKSGCAVLYIYVLLDRTRTKDYVIPLPKRNSRESSFIFIFIFVFIPRVKTTIK